MFEDLIGKEIDGCKIIKKLGEGGMGVAYSAHHGRLDRMVVVKFLDPEIAKDPKQVEGCLAEARAAAKIEHPRIVQVYDQGSQDGLHFIVMQFVDGETAEDLLLREGKLEPIKAVQIVRAALEGLVEAHKAGIVHRDVKPSNILLGKDGSIRLSDFGLALKMTKEGKAKGQTIGTPLYMSPEQIWGQEVDGRCDLYSMGATLFHFITGSPPFTAESPSDIIAMHVNNPPPDARAANKDVSKYASRLISRMMAKKPEERPASAQEVITALDSPAMIMAEASVTGERQIDLGIAPGSRPPRSFSGDAHAPTPADPRFTPPPGRQAAPPPEEALFPEIKQAPGAWRAPAAGLLMLSAGITAYASGFLAQPFLLSAPLVLIGAAAALARKGAGVLAPAMIALGAAALFWAGLEGVSAASLAAAVDRRALYLPTGLISAAAAIFAAPSLFKARWPSGVIIACAALTTPALFVFALPAGHGWGVLLDNSARHPLALPLLFAGPVCSLLAVLIYQKEVNTVGPVSMILAGTLAVYAAGAVHSPPQPPKPLKGKTAKPSAARGVVVVIENGQTVVKQAPLPEDLEAAAEKNRPPRMLRPLKGYPKRFRESGGALPVGGALCLLGSILYWRRTRRTPALFES